ncbi:MAG: phosphate regulon sensor histidine kinase PhoR [Candidatus Accumulibacter sp.]|nr:phosphate regulon sensor histidine kinase PhoR [Accumulibacter sp.]
MPAQIVRAALLALLTACVAAPLGVFVAPWAGWLLFCGGLILQMAFHFRNLARLDRWSRAPDVDASLEGKGAWDGIFGRLYRHEKDLRRQIADRDAEIARIIAAIQALNDGVILLDPDNRIVFCNTMVEEQLGLSLRTDEGLPIVNLIRRPEFVDYLGGGDFTRPLTLRFEHGEERALFIVVIPYAGNRRLMHVKDVTQTDRLDRMRRDFVANVSHELRTPLTVLSGFLETLGEIEVDARTRGRYLTLMAEQARRMENIVQDLLTLSSIESAPPPGDEVVDMARLVDKLRRDAEALSGGRHTVSVESDGLADLRGVEPELASAFGNLVSNAVRYTPAGGTIRIAWKTSPDGAEFAVEDTGIGIDAKHIPRLTERFYRVDRGRSREAGGTGLGLAIVKHALNRHQARLEIRSDPGKGSRFTAKFPPGRLARP